MVMSPALLTVAVAPLPAEPRLPAMKSSSPMSSVEATKPAAFTMPVRVMAMRLGLTRYTCPLALTAPAMVDGVLPVARLRIAEARGVWGWSSGRPPSTVTPAMSTNSASAPAGASGPVPSGMKSSPPRAGGAGSNERGVLCEADCAWALAMVVARMGTVRMWQSRNGVVRIFREFNFKCATLSPDPCYWQCSSATSEFGTASNAIIALIFMRERYFLCSWMRIVRAAPCRRAVDRARRQPFVSGGCWKD